jgi:2-dehydro-3-deoxygluconokinase
MKKKILCFGELLLRISPEISKNFSKSPFQLYIGGAEANVATALASWNVPVKYCTALPPGFMSRYLINYLEYKGIYTSSIISCGERIGIYYLDRGADLKSSVIYDRVGSSFSELRPGQIDWDEVLQDVSWFNFTAISPALNQNVADVCLEALIAASAKNITISIDLNYRARLWKYGQTPLKIMPKLVEYCDLIMGNIWSANTLLGTELNATINIGDKRAYLDHAEKTSKEIINRYPKCKSVGNTFRFDLDNELSYYTTLYTEGILYDSPEFTSQKIIDRSGSGDCFMAGLIYGFYNDHPVQDVLNYATAAAFGKLRESGDATSQNILEVSILNDTLLNGT